MGLDHDPDLAALDAPRPDAERRMREHAAELDALLERGEAAARCGRNAEAAGLCELAATHAVLWHAGRFADVRLDGLVERIGRAACVADLTSARSVRTRRRVLHVATRLGEIGGHGRMLRAWIATDRTAEHHLALTRQTRALPAALVGAVRRSGGRVDVVNARGGPLDWARALQAPMAAADLVVLHVHNQDTVPFLALAGLRPRPQVLLVNHGDHLFWAGAGLVDAVACSRRSALDLAVARRGIPAERALLLPLLLEAPTRRRTREQAKAALGLPEDALVLLTLARGAKYAPLGNATYADAVLPVLLDAPRARLVAVGAGGQVDWSRAEAAAPGRVIVLPEQPDPSTFLEAADIALDSFPFGSMTSLLEAGALGAALAARWPFGPECGVLSADGPGLDEALGRSTTPEAFRADLAMLLADPAARAERGVRAFSAIAAACLETPWRSRLAELYATLDDLPARERAEAAPAEPRVPARVDSLVLLTQGRRAGSETAAARLAISEAAAVKALPFGTRLGSAVRAVAARPLDPWSAAAGLRRAIPETWSGARARRLAVAAQARVPGPDDLRVLFCIDPRYAEPLAVAALSVVLAHPGTRIDLHVMVTGEAAEAERQIAAALAPYPTAKLQFHRLPAERLEGLVVAPPLTLATYARMFAPEYLPPEADRVIYLDADLVVTGPLEGLWRTDLEGAVLAGCEDFWLYDRPQRLGLPAGSIYCQAGVLLLDLVAWWREALAERVLDFARTHGLSIAFADQDAINAVLHDRIRIVDRRYNLLPDMFRMSARARPFDHGSIREACRDAAVIHYAGPSKPWHAGSTVPMRHVWWRVRERLHWPAAASAGSRHALDRAMLEMGLDAPHQLERLGRVARRLRSSGSLRAPIAGSAP